MTAKTFLCVLTLSCLTGFGQAAEVKPISLHPDNPHYFLVRGKPAVLVGSTEHYGAVLNLDFNYQRYLETLAREGLNLTRTFSGSYVEPNGAFNIRSNTLAPAAGRYRSRRKRPYFRRARAYSADRAPGQ